MRRWLAVAVVAALAGCGAAPERIALEGVRGAMHVMRADWRGYVEADVTLDDAAREDRLGLWADTERLVRVGLGEEEDSDAEE